MSKRSQRFEELKDVIEQIDAGELNITVYKGMPVKIRFVAVDEIVLGENQLDMEPKVRYFEPRKWWKDKH